MKFNLHTSGLSKGMGRKFSSAVPFSPAGILALRKRREASPASVLKNPLGPFDRSKKKHTKIK
jgi:hypothetical protein